MSTNYCMPLLDACSVDVYAGNVFRLLGAPVDASPRALRRRLDDLKAALGLGQIEEEYGPFFRPEALPSTEALSQASSLLQDPQRRFVHEFFWFWPLSWGQSDADRLLQALAAGERQVAYDGWKGVAEQGEGFAAHAARHNLAVLAHSRALDAERQLLNPGAGAGSVEQEANAQWDAAVQHWEALHANSDFWEQLCVRVLQAGEARLTREFLQQFRTTLPVAFDNISAELAAAFARSSRLSRVALHVDIMRRTNAGEDDIGSSLRRVTAPLHTRLELAVQLATSDLPDKRREGATRAEQLLAAAREPLGVMAAVLGDASAEVREAYDQVASTMLICQVAYGNETHDWETSVRLLQQILKVARGDTIRQKVRENLETVKGNLVLARCWFCGTREGDAAHQHTVPLHRVVHLNAIAEGLGTNPNWLDDMKEAISGLSESDRAEASQALMRGGDPTITRVAQVKVPRCATCATVHKQAGALAWMAVLVLAPLAIWFAGTTWDGGAAVLAGAVGVVTSFVAAGALEKGRTAAANTKKLGEFREFPLVKDLLTKKWALGKPPAQHA